MRADDPRLLGSQVTTPAKIEHRDIRRIAVVADVGERAVQNYLKGKAVWPKTRDAVVEALRSLGFEAHVRAEDKQ